MSKEYKHFWKYHSKDNMDVHAVRLIEQQAERIKELEEFLRNIIMIDNMLCLLPTPIISKDILPQQGREDSVILLTCDKTSSPELFMKMIDTVLTKP